MTLDNNKYDDIKRKLRELKKLEMKIRSANFDFQKNSKPLEEFEKKEIV